MTMKRTTAAVSAVVLAAGLLAACSDHDSSPTMAHHSGGMMGGPDSSMMDHHMAGHGANSTVASGARVIEVTASSFAFAPSRITVRAGEPVAIRLRSQGTLHDLTSPKLELHVAATAGRTAVGGFAATTPGSYTFYCSVPGHRQAGMQGTIVVTPS